MCGIVAVKKFDGSPVDEALLLRMRDTMVHRGPDDAGLYTDGSVGLGHRRLSIVDLSASGHQPMCNEDGSIWLVFNGEIYNYVELREQLLSRGHRFSSTTDSEVIIHLYEERGERCVDEFNGMFAFVIWDSRRGKLFGARDRFGIKPFYYYTDGRQFLCASEIKAIVEDSAVPRTPNDRAIADYLFAGAPLADRTFFAGVSQLLPGHTLTIENGSVSVESYWDLSFEYGRNQPPETITAELFELLDDAVRVHCRSDAALGAHLSGGLDSSTVASFAARHVDRLKTFSIRFDAAESVYDETRFAKMVSENIGSEFIRQTASGGDLAQLYPSLIWHMDQPAAGGGDGGSSYYAAARLASEHVKVALTGHGGDEVFAGYPAQFQTAFGSTEMFSAAQHVSGGEIGGVQRLSRLLGSEGIKGVIGRLTNRLKPLTSVPEEDLWIRLHCGMSPERNLLLHPSFVTRLGGYSPVEDYLAPFRAAPTDQLLDRCLYHDLRVYLPQLLHKEDRASMAVSIESRVPLVDPRIAQYMGTLTPEQKVPGLVPKALLRRTAAPLLPEEVWQRRDKVPFAPPIGQWMAGALTPMVESLPCAPQCLERGVFNPDLIRNGRLTWGERLKMMNIELWFRLFIDREPALCERTGVAASGLVGHAVTREQAGSARAGQNHPGGGSGSVRATTGKHIT